MSGVGDLKMFIDGKWVDSDGGAAFEATSPATGEVIGTVPEGTRGDAQRAIAAANAAWGDWAARSAFDRAAAMRRVARVIEERRDDLARTLTLDQGKPLRAEAFDEVDELVSYYEMAAEDATRLDGLMPHSVDADKRVFVYRVPRGVVGVITPWNWPYTMPAEIVAPALAAGNAVVWVPAPTTSVCAVKLAECMVEADLPAGLFNLVTGPGPVIMLKTPAGSPASTMHSASATAHIDVDGAGTQTTALPDASAGASSSAGIVYGQFHGVIRPTTPRGTR